MKSEAIYAVFCYFLGLATGYYVLQPEKQCPICHTPSEKTTVDYASLQALIKKGECRGFDAKDIQKTIWVCGTNIFSEIN